MWFGGSVQLINTLGTYIKRSSLTIMHGPLFGTKLNWSASEHAFQCLISNLLIKICSTKFSKYGYSPQL